MADKFDLELLGFRAYAVSAKKLNIPHPDPLSRGPFCRLEVGQPMSDAPGVYAWIVNTAVMYVGMSGQLRQVVQGAKIGRTYNDYTYIPPSSVRQASSPRVRVNGLLNRALSDNADVSWWWVDTPTEMEAALLEARLIAEWSPPWNRTHPYVAWT